MKLKIDFHIHSQKSFDSTMSVQQIIETARQKGLDGVCICDHACTDIKDILENDNDDFIIIPAVEFTTGTNHIISLFLEKEPQINLKENLCAELNEIVAETKRCNGICILAHPFQNLKKGIDSVLKQTESILPLIDGMEIYNSRAPYKYSCANIIAGAHAERLKVRTVTAGSDAHLTEEIGNAYCTVECESRSLNDIKKAVIDGKVEIHGHHCNRTSIVKSNLIKARKTNSTVIYKLKSYIKYPIFSVKDITDKIFGRKY